MATITWDQKASGRGGVGGPLFGGGIRKIKTGTFDFDASYPTGGESIADIFAAFKSVKGVWMESPLASAGTGKHVVIDLTNQKALLYTNAATPAEVANASDQSGATGLSWLAWGS
jgi:hypothetical protein